MTEPVNPVTTYEAMPEAEPQAVVVYCSDPRFQTAFDQFIERQLGLRKGQFIPLVVAGGAGVLARPEQLPKEFKFMRERLDLFCGGHHSIHRVVLINHEDCAYYRMLARRLPGFLRPGADGQSHRPRADMKPIAAICDRLLSHLGVQIELYYARFTDSDHTRVTFDPIRV
ncbi:MAG: hypothetical protein JW955_24665 [Sedimentisphaerales bacterium]|nr:hypothetical protein [Sedimentisphaerales bacterium]